MKKFKYEMNSNEYTTIEGHRMKATEDGHSVPVAFHKDYVIQWDGKTIAARIDGQWYTNPFQKVNPNMN